MHGLCRLLAIWAMKLVLVRDDVTANESKTNHSRGCDDLQLRSVCLPTAAPSETSTKPATVPAGGILRAGLVFGFPPPLLAQIQVPEQFKTSDFL
jgi:hypothetical protein